MSNNPWGLIATYFNALGSNVSESEKARKEGEQQSQSDRRPGMQYQASQPIDQSSFEASSPATVGANLIGDFGKQFGSKILGGAVQGERDMYNPALTTQGGFMLGGGEKYRSDIAPYKPSLLSRFRR